MKNKITMAATSPTRFAILRQWSLLDVPMDFAELEYPLKAGALH